MEKPGSSSGDWAGDDSASPRERFAVLYKQYLPRVLRYVSYKVGNVALAEDLTANVFEKALVSYHRYHSERAAFSTWLFAIAHHTVADYFKVNRKKESIPLDLIMNMKSEDDPEDAISRKEDLHRLQALLSQLSAQEQEIISLKFGAEITNRQIAAMLNLSESNVWVILHRAVHKLRISFKGWQDG